MDKAWNLNMIVVVVFSLAMGGVGCSGGSAIPETPAGSSAVAPDQQFLKAASQGDVAALKSLLAGDATLIDAYGPQGMSPLQAAAQFGRNEAVKFLLESGADPTIADEDGNTPLNAARVEGHPDTAKIIEDAMAAKNGGAAK